MHFYVKFTNNFAHKIVLVLLTGYNGITGLAIIYFLVKFHIQTLFDAARIFEIYMKCKYACDLIVAVTTITSVLTLEQKAGKLIYVALKIMGRNGGC